MNGLLGWLRCGYQYNDNVTLSETAIMIRFNAGLFTVLFNYCFAVGEAGYFFVISFTKILRQFCFINITGHMMEGHGLRSRYYLINILKC